VIVGPALLFVLLLLLCRGGGLLTPLFVVEKEGDFEGDFEGEGVLLLFPLLLMLLPLRARATGDDHAAAADASLLAPKEDAPKLTLR
jgi:hypothetical protein